MRTAKTITVIMLWACVLSYIGQHLFGGKGACPTEGNLLIKSKEQKGSVFDG